jgi:tetratricopeptide (TPR) repeat protein
MKAPALVAAALVLLTGCTVSGATRALAYYRQAKAYSYKGDYDRAIAYFDTTLTLFARPLATEVYVDRGVAYYSKGMIDRAIADFDTALVIDSENPRALGDRGAAYLALNQPARAITDLDAALRLQPGITWVRHRRAVAWEEMDSLTRAIADLDTVLVTWKDRPEVVAQRARLVARVRR